MDCAGKGLPPVANGGSGQVLAPPMLPAAAELIGRIAWLIRLRWVAVAGVALFLEVARRLFPVQLAVAPLWAILICLGVYNAVLWLVAWHLRGVPAGRIVDRFRPLVRVLLPRAIWNLEPEGQAAQAAVFANVQISLDLLALAALLHFAGGIENPFIFFFVFHSVIAAILLSRRASYLQTGLGFFLISLVAVGEATGVLAHYPLDGVWRAGAYREPLLVGAQLFVLGTTLFLAVYMGGTIAAHLRGREREVLELSEEVERRASMLEGAYRRLAELERAKSAYMRKVAHELRRPIGAVQTTLRVVLEGAAGGLEDPTRQLVARAEKRVDELSQLTDDLLALSRAREAGAAVEDAPVDLAALVAEAVADQAARAAAGGVDVSLTTPAGLLVLGDGDGLRQLVGNLLANAIRYTPRGGRVVVSLAEAAAGAWLEVADSGIGIPPEDQARVFDEFFRAANAREFARDGTGLGLAIVRAVVDRHGGELQVESAPGTGSRFTVILPRLAGRTGR